MNVSLFQLVGYSMVYKPLQEQSCPINTMQLGINLSMAAGDFIFFQSYHRKSRVDDEEKKIKKGEWVN